MNEINAFCEKYYVYNVIIDDLKTYNCLEDFVTEVVTDEMVEEFIAELYSVIEIPFMGKMTMPELAKRLELIDYFRSDFEDYILSDIEAEIDKGVTTFNINNNEYIITKNKRI